MFLLLLHFYNGSNAVNQFFLTQLPLFFALHIPQGPEVFFHFLFTHHNYEPGTSFPGILHLRLAAATAIVLVSLDAPAPEFIYQL